MTTPDRDEGIAPEAALEGLEDFPADENAENAILGWAKAVVFGIGDTAKDILTEGRRGAREAMEDGWDRFDSKTKHRRE